MTNDPIRTQATFKALKDKIENLTIEKIETRLEEISYYATHTALQDGGLGTGVDTGAYVTSFSLGAAGFSGGRKRSSRGKPTKQDAAAKKQEGYSNLLSDIKGLNIKQMLSLGNIKFTLRNRSPHARKVEDGWTRKDGSKLDGYNVFRKIRSKFR